MAPSKWDEVDPEAAEREAAAKAAVRASLAKRRRLESAGAAEGAATAEGRREEKAPESPPAPRVRSRAEGYGNPPICGCRSVRIFDKLNRIEEGSYGIVIRARNRDTGEIVALKQLKLEKEREGFPMTSLREIYTLMEARHPHIVELKEMVVGSTLSQCVHADRVYLVMEFVEHDLKTLLSTMRTPFLHSEVKTLMLQILSAVELLHSRWIIHRDLKTSNLLMNNRGQIKLADFGLARMFGDPLGRMTSLVVTMWYRAPELLLGAAEYDTAVDLWSVGCIFAELLLREPLFPGKNETDQIARVYAMLGAPDDAIWPGYSALPHAKNAPRTPVRGSLRHKLRDCTPAALDLLQGLLTYDPSQRLTATAALDHPYFREAPAPAHPDTFGSFPSAAAGEKRQRSSPAAPARRAGQM